MVGSGGHVVVLVRKSSTGGGGEDEKINGNGIYPEHWALVLWLAD